MPISLFSPIRSTVDHPLERFAFVRKATTLFDFGQKTYVIRPYENNGKIELMEVKGVRPSLIGIILRVIIISTVIIPMITAFAMLFLSAICFYQYRNDFQIWSPSTKINDLPDEVVRIISRYAGPGLLGATCKRMQVICKGELLARKMIRQVFKATYNVPLRADDYFAKDLMKLNLLLTKFDLKTALKVGVYTSKVLKDSNESLKNEQEALKRRNDELLNLLGRPAPVQPVGLTPQELVERTIQKILLLEDSSKINGKLSSKLNKILGSEHQIMLLKAILPRIYEFASDQEHANFLINQLALEKLPFVDPMVIATMMDHIKDPDGISAYILARLGRKDEAKLVMNNAMQSLETNKYAKSNYFYIINTMNIIDRSSCGRFANENIHHASIQDLVDIVKILSKVDQKGALEFLESYLKKRKTDGLKAEWLENVATAFAILGFIEKAHTWVEKIVDPPKKIRAQLEVTNSYVL